MATHLYTFINPIRTRDVEAICQVLENDGVIAVPMDVAWSFVCDGASPKALSRIHRLKPETPKNRPFSLVCDSLSMASNIVTIDNNVYPWLKKALPGPYTFLLDRHTSLAKQIHDKRREVGLRIPSSELVLAIVKNFARPLAASTVPPIGITNIESRILPGFGWEVDEAFGHGLDMVVDLGEESLKSETTIVDLTSGLPKLVRRGAGNIFDFGFE